MQTPHKREFPINRPPKKNENGERVQKQVIKA